jgi:hypothetical protein
MAISTILSSNLLFYPHAVLNQDLRSLIDRYLHLEGFVVLLDVSPTQRQAVITSVFYSIIWKHLRTSLGFRLESKDPIPRLLHQIINRYSCYPRKDTFSFCT